MGRPITEDNLDTEVDAALDRAQREPRPVHILSAYYHTGPEMDFLEMRLSDSRRLLVPREELGELRNATPDQAADLQILTPGSAIYWPQLDDGLALADFLQYRWRKTTQEAAA